ncbi:MAG: hypothetical protein RR336_12435, partial [Oscillospiraceae bacterium]
IIAQVEKKETGEFRERRTKGRRKAPLAQLDTAVGRRGLDRGTPSSVTPLRGRATFPTGEGSTGA